MLNSIMNQSVLKRWSELSFQYLERNEFQFQETSMMLLRKPYLIPQIVSEQVRKIKKIKINVKISPFILTDLFH